MISRPLTNLSGNFTDWRLFATFKTACFSLFPKIFSAKIPYQREILPRRFFIENPLLQKKSSSAALERPLNSLPIREPEAR